MISNATNHALQSSYPWTLLKVLPVWGIFLASAILLGALGGCATTGDGNSLGDMSASQLATKGRDELGQGNYQNAIDLFLELEKRYPYDQNTEAARLQLAYALYKNQQPQLAIETAENFIKLYPEHKNLAYAFYVRALASFAISSKELQNGMGQPPADEVLTSTRLTFEYFSELASRFPKSRYFNDAMTRIVKLRDDMARYEIHAANHYFLQNDFQRAQDRANYVTRYYARSPSVPNALAIVAKSQLELGNKRKANETLSLLEGNYPDELVTQKTREYFRKKPPVKSK